MKQKAAVIITIIGIAVAQTPAYSGESCAPDCGASSEGTYYKLNVDFMRGDIVDFIAAEGLEPSELMKAVLAAKREQLINDLGEAAGAEYSDLDLAYEILDSAME
ncbi:MAG: hypothetical protein AAB425_16155 [Bdellovibrionota bacterium]